MEGTHFKGTGLHNFIDDFMEDKELSDNHIDGLRAFIKAAFDAKRERLEDLTVDMEELEKVIRYKIYPTNLQEGVQDMNSRNNTPLDLMK